MGGRLLRVYLAQPESIQNHGCCRAWKITLEVKEVNTGASQRERRESLLEAARRREIDVVLVWSLHLWGSRSQTFCGLFQSDQEHPGHARDSAVPFGAMRLFSH